MLVQILEGNNSPNYPVLSRISRILRCCCMI
jgi:hypothetical protein